ncbi:unnamed protein product [[Candida] boidinii]|uniref:N(6)-L-threonylcarbamoyladenine synthase n=1 Tax=Candida boidinii TaxID=5477 RepID=A0A9W6SU86_CANBO|nr:unnamed protein product [[Candida] boidinii]
MPKRDGRVFCVEQMASLRSVCCKLSKYPVSTIRTYKVLAIETSCDDACVSILDRFSKDEPPIVLEEHKLTLDSIKAGGVVPTDAANHNRKSISLLVKQVVEKNNFDTNPPDLICATRGPGMVGSLASGFTLAIGLSVAWNKPLVGVHHMLGHLLVPRLKSNGTKPCYPFLSLLVSGGHTIVVLSKSLLVHEILVDTLDIAAGDAIDKCGRELGIRGNMIGKELEVFLNNHKDQWNQEIKFDMKEPMQNQWDRKDVLAYSFAAFNSQVKSSLKKYHNSEIPKDEKIVARMAHLTMKTIFKHLISKIKLAIKLNKDKMEGVTDFVCSGGVASNSLLREMLQQNLSTNGIKNFYFPEPSLCTDNATMIGWAGIELYESAKLTTDVGTTVFRKWPIDKILDVDGWIKCNE